MWILLQLTACLMIVDFPSSDITDVVDPPLTETVDSATHTTGTTTDPTDTTVPPPTGDTGTGDTATGDNGTGATGDTSTPAPTGDTGVGAPTGDTGDTFPTTGDTGVVVDPPPTGDTGGVVDTTPTGDTGVVVDTTPTGDTGTAPTGDTGGPIDLGPPLVIGDLPGDQIGATGVWAVGGDDDDDDGELVIGEDGAIALFRDPILHTVPFSSAQLVLRADSLGSTFADLGDHFAVGQPSAVSVWIISDTELGDVDPSAVDTGVITSHEADSALGVALDSGDWDGDGVLDLALGDPTVHSGDGEVYIVPNVVAAAAAATTAPPDPLNPSVEATDMDVRLRGLGDVPGLGTSVLLGDLDGTGTDDLMICDTSWVCGWIPGDTETKDVDVDQYVVGSVTGSPLVPFVRGPHLVDVDGDGQDDLIGVAADQAGVWFGPLAESAHDWTDVDWLVDGAAVGGVTGAGGSLLVGAPTGAGALYAATVDGDFTLGAVVDVGEVGDGLGAQVTDVIPYDDDLHNIGVAVPGSDRAGADAGEVRLLTWP